MGLHNDILSNINTRYALLRKGENYQIVDVLRRSVVVIDNPLIKFDVLVKMMIEKGAKIYTDPKELPDPVELPVSIKDAPKGLRIFMKKLFDERSIDTGTIITALLTHRTDKEEKKNIEAIMERYAFTVLYPNEGLNFYSEVNDDSASLIVIRNINNLPSNDDIWSAKDIYNW